jgi:hypothetical protein
MFRKLTRPDNEATVELESDVESDEESEQEYYMIYRPDEDPQNNTNSDAHHVDSDQARTINIGRRRFLCSVLFRPPPFSR